MTATRAVVDTIAHAVLSALVIAGCLRIDVLAKSPRFAEDALAVALLLVEAIATCHQIDALAIDHETETVIGSGIEIVTFATGIEIEKETGIRTGRRSATRSEIGNGSESVRRIVTESAIESVTATDADETTTGPERERRTAMSQAAPDVIARRSAKEKGHDREAAKHVRSARWTMRMH